MLGSPKRLGRVFPRLLVAFDLLIYFAATFDSYQRTLKAHPTLLNGTRSMSCTHSSSDTSLNVHMSTSTRITYHPTRLLQVVRDPYSDDMSFTGYLLMDVSVSTLQGS
jgi:hypothetical protein